MERVSVFHNTSTPQQSISAPLTPSTLVYFLRKMYANFLRMGTFHRIPPLLMKEKEGISYTIKFICFRHKLTEQRGRQKINTQITELKDLVRFFNLD
jgi:hypothetical protein